MAYDTEELKAKAEEAIEEHNLFFVEDIVAYLPCSKPTFYDHFPKESNEFNALKESLYANRIRTKVSMRNNWEKSKNATLQMGLMKLLSSDEELRKLSMEHKEHSGSVATEIKGVNFGNED